MTLQDQKDGNSIYSHRNQARLVRGGKEYFDCLLGMIENARDSIHFQTYIFEGDKTGTDVAAALIRAAGRGVPIYLLVDGYASQGLPGGFIRALKQAGVQFRWFEPVFRSRFFYFGRRMHHKVVVVDSLYSLVGGVNISDRYNDLPGSPAWLDYAIYAKGEVSADLGYVCINRWNRSGWGKKKNVVINDLPVPHPVASECLVRVRRNDWVRHRNQISRSYLEMFKKARHSILIMSSYFLPGRVFRKNLVRAARRGVKIRVIVAGKSDVFIAKNAERYIYQWLFKNNIELYEYLPNILHGKISTYDGAWVTAGSYNVNNISAYASIELNLDVKDPEFARAVQQEMEGIIKNHCIQLNEKEFSHRFPFWNRLWQRISYEMVRFIFFLFTFYFKQRE